MPHIFLEISKNEMIFKTPLETKQETIPIEIIIKLIFFKIKNIRFSFCCILEREVEQYFALTKYDTILLQEMLKSIIMSKYRNFCHFLKKKKHKIKHNFHSIHDIIISLSEISIGEKKLYTFKDNYA